MQVMYYQILHVIYYNYIANIPFQNGFNLILKYLSINIIFFTFLESQMLKQDILLFNTCNNFKNKLCLKIKHIQVL